MIELGKNKSYKSKTVLVEISLEEFARLLGCYSLYDDACPQPEIGVEYNIHGMFNKQMVLEHSHTTCKQIKELANYLLGSLPKGEH